MAHRLKTEQEEFRVVDGAFANKTYKHGEVYEAIPPEEKHRFETVRAAAPKPPRSSARGTDPGSGADAPAAPAKTE